MNDCNIDLPPKEIFDGMKKNIHNTFPTSVQSSIDRHYLSNRRKLFIILNTINRALSFKSRTFFLCAYYLDLVHLSKKVLEYKTDLLGLACLVIATKVCENDPEVPLLKYFLEVYNMITDYKKQFTIDELSSAELYVIKLLNHKINYYTIYDFNSFFFNNGIVKIEQLEDIDNTTANENTSRRRYIDSNSEHDYSLKIKNILEQMYRKSRYYIDIIVNRTNLCFKYNSLVLTLHIIEKTIIEVLGNEQKIKTREKEVKEEFYKKNALTFKEIIFDFYGIKLENNEQYRKLIKDKEIQDLFNKGEEEEKPPQANSHQRTRRSPDLKKNNEQKENNNSNNNKSKLKRNKTHQRDNNKSLYTSSVFNEPCQKIKIEVNPNESNKKQNKRLEKIAIRTRIRMGMDKNNNQNISTKNSFFKNSRRNRDENKNNLSTTNKTDTSIFKKKEKENITRVTKQYSYIPTKSKNIQRNKSYISLKNNKTQLFKNNYDLNSVNNTYHEIKYSKSKKNEDKSMRYTQIKYDEEVENEYNTNNNDNNGMNSNRVNKFRKINRTSKGKEVNFSNNIIDANNCTKKTFYKQLNQKTETDNNNKINERNKETEIMEYYTMNEDNSNNNNNNEKHNNDRFYMKMNLRKRVKADKINTYNSCTNIDNDNEKTAKNNNKINNRNNNNNNISSNDSKVLIIPLNKYRKRFQDILNHNITNEIKNKDIIIVKDNKTKDKITNNNKNNYLNDNKEYKTKKLFKNENDKIIVNVQNYNISDKKFNKNKKRDFKEVKSMANLFNMQNNLLKGNTNRRYSNNANTEINSGRITNNIIETKIIDNNNNNKIINRNCNIKVNVTNNSIRKKYLGMNKHKSYSNLNERNTDLNESKNNCKIENENKNNSKNNSNYICESNINRNKIKNTFSFMDKYYNPSNGVDNSARISHNINNITNRINLINKIPINTTEKKEKNKQSENDKSSMNRINLQTKILFNRNNNDENNNKNNLYIDKRKNPKVSHSNNNIIHKSGFVYNQIINEDDKSMEQKKIIEENIKNQQDQKIGNNSYLRNIVYKSSNKVDNNRITNQKSFSSNVTVSNMTSNINSNMTSNINSNINSNKNSNTNSNANSNANTNNKNDEKKKDYLKIEYKNNKYIIKRNHDNEQSLYNNYLNYKNDLSKINRSHINKSIKNSDNIQDNSDKILSNLKLNKMHFRKKLINKDKDKDNDKVKDKYNTYILTQSKTLKKK